MFRLDDTWRANSSNPAIARQGCINWITLIYFASGACSLIDEVVWVRLLKLTLGNTVYASSIVVSIFMGGLALGALIMGRYCDRVRRHLRLYAILETLVTISALSLPWALRLADNVYVWFYRTYHPTHPQLLIVQVIISAAIVLVPSMLMGSTLPLLGRFVTALERQAGHLVGKLYALNTLGAAVGCFLAGFVFIRALGVMGTLYTAAGLNLLVAFGGWFLSRFSRIIPEEQVETSMVKSPEVVRSKTTDGRFYLLIFAFFMSGLISIGYELLWMRSVLHLLGGATYVFSAVLTVYLLGNVIGAGIGSRLAKRLKRPAAGFAVTLSLLGACGLCYLPLMIVWTSRVLPHINKMLEVIYSKGMVAYMIGPIVQSVFLFLIPAIIMGIGFPIALQAWANHIHKVGRATGTAYGANTIGAVIGGIVTGFALIPLLGLQLSISILGLIGIWMGGIMWMAFARNLKAGGRYALLAAAALLTIVATRVPLNLFNIVVKTSPVSPIEPDYRIVCVKEGITTTVSLYESLKEGFLHMHSSGQSIAGDSYVVRGDQKMLGHFGVFINADAKKVLSVGFGSGETTNCLSKHELDRIDCAEIAPEIVDVALKFFRHINLGDRLNKEINMIFMDAKNYIHLTDNKYDVIINDSIHPRDFAENASLYTKEYFEGVREHLNRNGMIFSWLPLCAMPASVLNSIIGTMMDVFPHVTMWYLTVHPAPLVMIAGSEQQQYFSPKHIENELLNESVRKSLAEIDIHNSVDVLSCYVGDKNDLRKCIKAFRINSDYSPFVEFTTDSITDESQNFSRFVMNVRGKSIYEHIDWTGFSEKEKEKWLADYQQLYKASNYLFMANSSNNYMDRLKYSMEGLSVLPDNPALITTRTNAEAELFAIAAKMIMSGKIKNALVTAGKMLEIYPQSATAWMIRSAAMQQMGDAPRALASARQAVDLSPEDPEVRLNLGGILFNAGQFQQAITEYEKMLRLAKQDDYPLTSHKKAKMLEVLAGAYAAAGRFSEAVATAERALDLALPTEDKELVESISEQLLLFKAGRSGQQQR